MAAGNPFIPQSPQIQDPLQQYGRLVALRTALQQGQSMQGQQALQSQEIQRGQLQLQDQSELSRAWHDAGGDLGEYQANLLSPSYNISPAGRQQSLSTIFQTRQEAFKLKGQQFEFAHQQATALNEAYDELNALPAEQRPAAYERKLSELQSEGVDVSHLPPQYNEQAFAQFAVPLKTTAQVLDERAKQADIALKNQQQATSAAQQKKIQHEAEFGPPSDVNLYIANYLKLHNLPNTPENWAAAHQAYTKETKLQPAQIRVEGYGSIRQNPVYDTKTGQTLYMDSNTLNAMNRAEPGRYTVPSYTPGAIGQRQTTEYFTSGKGG